MVPLKISVCMAILGTRGWHLRELPMMEGVHAVAVGSISCCAYCSGVLHWANRAHWGCDEEESSSMTCLECTNLWLYLVSSPQYVCHSLFWLVPSLTNADNLSKKWTWHGLNRNHSCQQLFVLSSKLILGIVISISTACDKWPQLSSSIDHSSILERNRDLAKNDKNVDITSLIN